MGRELEAGLYGYNDLEVGDWYMTPSAEVDAARIDGFADVSGDRYAAHMDKTAAERLGYHDRLAHGLLGLAMTDGLKHDAAAQVKGIVSLGWTWSFDGPVVLGDSISARIEIEAKRLTSKGDRGILTMRFTVTNQNGEKVQSGTNLLLTAL